MRNTQARRRGLQEEEPKFEVEEILKHRFREQGGEREYFVKWQGWNKLSNSWASETSMGECSLLPAYKKKHKLK